MLCRALGPVKEGRLGPHNLLFKKYFMQTSLLSGIFYYILIVGGEMKDSFVSPGNPSLSIMTLEYIDTMSLLFVL